MACTVVAPRSWVKTKSYKRVKLHAVESHPRIRGTRGIKVDRGRSGGPAEVETDMETVRSVTEDTTTDTETTGDGGQDPARGKERRGDDQDRGVGIEEDTSEAVETLAERVILPNYGYRDEIGTNIAINEDE